MTKRVLAYTRVSARDQAENGASLSVQEERIRHYCAAKGWTVIRAFTENASAATLDRPELHSLRELVRRKKADVVMVWRLDRLTRSVPDLHRLLAEFDEPGVAFASVTESFDTTTPAGRLNMNLIASIAAWQREDLLERTALGLGKKKRDLRKYSRIIPYGFEEKDGRLIPVETELANVRLMFRWRRKKTYEEIAKRLNDRNVRTKQCKRWHPSTVRYVLLNDVYEGVLKEAKPLESPAKPHRPKRNHRGGPVKDNQEEAQSDVATESVGRNVARFLQLGRGY